MARKKQEIQLQREIETQEEWEECMAMEGLWVVDVYQEWCGPCQALVGNFRRLKNELGDTLLNFAIAKADTIDALDKYRGRCEPTFLFYAGGILTSFIHGANAPKVQRVITEQLAHEHKVLEGTAERKEVKDSVITRQQELEDEKALEEAAQREAEVPGGSGRVVLEAKGVTVAIIKPDAVAQGKADEIKNEMIEKGIEIIAEEERTLTEEEAREIYSDLQEEEYFDELMKFITSGPSHLLVLTRGTTGETIVKDWRDMIGPTNVEEAKSEAPDSLRAKYGEKGYMNALHGSCSSDAAAKELAFFFPNLAIPTYQKKKENIQRTLALIRPQAFADKKDEILAKINEAGFKIAMYKEIELTREQAADFYKEHEQFPYFEQLVETMSSGTMLALGLARDEAISAWRDMLGPANIDEAQETAPDSLRAQYPLGESGINMFHGSDSEEAAKKELNYFFPVEQTIGVIKPAAMGTKDAIIEKVHEAGFRIAAHKETVITQEIAEILYPHVKDKEFYDDLVTSMTSGPTMFMVLSREDAVNGWRREIGDADPEQAKASNPDSLRAKYGQDILNNAVHGSSNPERAIEEMKAVFGELNFNTDGTIQGEQPELDEAVVEETTGETTMDETSVDPTADTTATAMDATVDETRDMTTVGDETTDMTADTTEDQTADLTTVEETPTMDETTAGEETTVEGEATAAGGEETAAAGEETQAEETATVAGDETTVTTTQSDETTADETTTVTADETTVAAGDETAADQTVDQTADQPAEQAPAPEKTDESAETKADDQKQPEAENAPADAKGDSTDTKQEGEGHAEETKKEDGEATETKDNKEEPPAEAAQ